MAQAQATPGAVLKGDSGDSLVQGKAQSGIVLSAVVVGVLAVSAAAIFIRLVDAPLVAIRSFCETNPF